MSNPVTTDGAPLQVGVHEAKTSLSRLLKRVESGEEVVISRGGRPVARLVAIRPGGRRQLGMDAGLYEVPDDFDEPLPAAEEEHFYH